MAEEDGAATEIAAVEGGGKKEFVPPTDGSWIPRERFNEVNQSVNQLRDELAKEREARIRLEEQGKPKTVSRAELLTMVEEGKISQVQADEAWKKMIVDEVRGEVSKELGDRMSEGQSLNSVKTEIARYKEMVPDVMTNGTEERDKVFKEYQYLISIGMKEDARTELTALRSVYGSPEKLKRKLQRQERETHEEIGGGEKPETKDEHKVLKSLTPREKAHYEEGIRKGLYKDWEDVEKEMAYSNPTLRRKMGAKT